ncbi:hypothetical protein V6Z12_D07G128400 [Gossypium hirsutum]
MDPEAARTARESLDLAFHMSNILDTGLDRHTLSVLVALCDLGTSKRTSTINPVFIFFITSTLTSEFGKSMYLKVQMDEQIYLFVLYCYCSLAAKGIMLHFLCIKQQYQGLILRIILPTLVGQLSFLILEMAGR